MRRALLAFVLTGFVVAAPAAAIAQGLPDPRQMSGVPLPVGDVAAGTVTVRVIRGSFTHPVPSQTVELTGGATPVSATTDGAGRAEFSGLAPGTRLQARAVVAGQTLESEVFTVPSSGGIRLMLVASDPAGETASAGGPIAREAGAVVIGDESRFIFEMGEDGISVFYVLQIVNRSRVPAEPDPPLVFELPAAARSATLLDGSSPQASITGRELRIAGPIAPGPTMVQIAYSLPLDGSERVVEQRLPATLTHVAVVAQKVGALELASPQIGEQRTMPAQGQLYIAGRGGPVQAGEVLRFHLTGLPHHPRWPRNLAIALAVLILGAGVWASFSSAGQRQAVPAGRRQLERDRDRLLEELAALETRHRAGAVDPAAYAVGRRELVTALEGIYAALDDAVALGKAS